MSRATEVVVWGRTTGGKTARMGRRTAAHVDYTIERLAREHPGAKLHVIQSAYNTGVSASAGTHDKDGCLDVWIEGLGWWEQQAFLRKCGWAAWYRYPPTFGRHIHMISLGCPGPMGRFVPGQISDYYNGRNGLAGHARDTSWRPDNIAATVFDFEEWENEMKKEEVASAPIKMLSGPKNKVQTVTLQGVLRDLEQTQDRHGARLVQLDKDIKAIQKEQAAQKKMLAAILAAVSKK